MFNVTTPFTTLVDMHKKEALFTEVSLPLQTHSLQKSLVVC